MGTSTKDRVRAILDGDDGGVRVWLGNRDAIELLEDPDDREAAAAEERAPNQLRVKLPDGKRCTTVALAPGLTLLEAAHDITHPARGVWQAHSDAPAPAWVASTNAALAQILAAHWGCELREPQPDHAASDTEEG